jgi:hypothetical protein
MSPGDVRTISDKKNYNFSRPSGGLFFYALKVLDLRSLRTSKLAILMAASDHVL